MWKFHIRAGTIQENNGPTAPAYSGHGDAKGDPSKCGVVMVGPIPPGKYRIGMAYKHDHLGPCTMNLDPMLGTNTLGRSLFRIHGDSSNHPGDSSHGCVITGPAIRTRINNSQDRILEVTP